MKVDRKTRDTHRAAILEHAGRLFRRHGIENVGVADVTRAAGLTHGAFYGHFPSKTALAAEACRHSLSRGAEMWRRRAAEAERDGLDPLCVLIDLYLSPERRDAPELSCALASLGAEASRSDALRPALAEGAEAVLSVMRELIARRRPAAEPRAHDDTAIALFSVLSGGLTLARALAADPQRSDQALAAARSLARLAVAA